MHLYFFPAVATQYISSQKCCLYSFLTKNIFHKTRKHNIIFGKLKQLFFGVRDIVHIAAENYKCLHLATQESMRTLYH